MVSDNKDDHRKESIIIYTDGACAGNPGPGGYAAIIIGEDTRKEVRGFKADTTNNRMELIAVIEGLKAISKGSKIKIFSDSNYVIKGITQWVNNWKKNGWKTSNKNDVKNKKLWIELDNLAKEYDVEFLKVKGHAGNEYNEKADALAKEQIELHKKE